jgi:hypothetical protein
LRIVVPVLDMPREIPDDSAAHRTGLRAVVLLGRPPTTGATVGALRPPATATSASPPAAHGAVVPVRSALLPAALLSPLSPLAALLLRLTGA